MNHLSRFPSGTVSASSSAQPTAIADPREKDSGSGWALTAFFAAMLLILIVSAFLVKAIRMESSGHPGLLRTSSSAAATSGHWGG